MDQTFEALLRQEDLDVEALLRTRLPPTSKIDVNRLIAELRGAQARLAKMHNNKFRLCYKYEHLVSQPSTQDEQRRQVDILAEANALLKATINLLEKYP